MTVLEQTRLVLEHLFSWESVANEPSLGFVEFFGRDGSHLTLHGDGSVYYDPHEAEIPPKLASTLKEFGWDI